MWHQERRPSLLVHNRPLGGHEQGFPLGEHLRDRGGILLDELCRLAVDRIELRTDDERAVDEPLRFRVLILAIAILPVRNGPRVAASVAFAALKNRMPRQW